MICPNKKPTRPFNGIALIGESPGDAEFQVGEPFAGPSGRILNGCLASALIDRDACYLGNINRESKWTQDAVQDSFDALAEDFTELKPSVICLMGQKAMDKSGISGKITDWRGSIIKAIDIDAPFSGFKCVLTVNPAYVMRNWDMMPLFEHDLRRVKEESSTPTFTPPNYSFDLFCEESEIIRRLDNIRSGDLIALDIEGGVTTGMSCVSIATSPNEVFIIVPSRYSLEGEMRVMRAFARVMKDPSIGKILQNSLYDNFVLSWLYKCPIFGVAHDTMLSGWEIFPELPKGLGVQTSIWTRQPYYKYQRKIDDETTHHRYCCTDSAITYEIALKHKEYLTLQPHSIAHFKFNMSLLDIMLFMELKGIKYDHAEADKLLAITKVELAEAQTRLDAIASQAMFPKPAKQQCIINVASPKQVCSFLYDYLGMPRQHPKVGNAYDRSKTTSDVNALLNLAKSHNNQVIRDLLLYRKKDKLREILEVKCDKDGRIRGSYNIVGTETGRLSCSKPLTETGMNLQTVPKKLRHLFRADDNKYLFQCDLAGADGWTVAAHCAALGDPTMLEDYYAGIKPAKVIVLLYNIGAEVASWSREKIKDECRSVSEEGSEGWLYFTAKRVQHGTNYALGKLTMSDQILKDSYKVLGKPIYVPAKECERLQNLYIQYRYQGVRRWQNWVKTQLEKYGQLSCASGHVRTFFGRRSDHATFRAALSHEPQANTTYATNLAMSALWNDPENRNNNTLHIEPLHQVHDAVIGQFDIDKASWATQRIRSYFANPIHIAGQQITIPFDGGYGPSWGELNHPLDF